MTDHPYQCEDNQHQYQYQHQHQHQQYHHSQDQNDPLLKFKQSLTDFTAAVSKDATQLRSYNDVSLNTQQKQQDVTRMHSDTNNNINGSTGEYVNASYLNL